MLGTRLPSTNESIYRVGVLNLGIKSCSSSYLLPSCLRSCMILVDGLLGPFLLLVYMYVNSGLCPQPTDGPYSVIIMSPEFSGLLAS